MEVNIVEIDIDQAWSLQDFYVMSKNYIQCYSVIYSLSDIELPRPEYERFRDYLKGEYARYPWKGGYSAVNFYKNIFNRIPFEHQPQIVSIAYASPGKIKLKEVAKVAATLAAIITSACISLDKVHSSYNQIQKGISERKLSKIEISSKELELKEEEMKFVHESLKLLIQDLQLSQELIKQLKNKTNGNELMQLKILMSLYRRIEPLAIMQSNGLLNVQKHAEQDHLYF